MIPLIEREIVEKQQWIKKEDFLDLLALAQSVPGIFAVNIAIFIGYKLRQFKGALAMTLGTVLPSFLIILSIALFFRQYQHVEIVERIFKGIRPAVVALIAAPCFKMAKTARINKYNCWIPVMSALLIWLLGFSPIYIIILTGVGGFIYGKILDRPIRSNETKSEKSKSKSLTSKDKELSEDTYKHVSPHRDSDIQTYNNKKLQEGGNEK